MTDTNETGGKPVHKLELTLSLKEGENKKEKVLAVLKFMRNLSDFEKRSAKKNFLVGRKKD